MSFSVFVAADVYGVKTNFELSFPARPSVADAVRMTEQVYSAECAVRRPDGVPHHLFHISKLKVFDDVVQKWIDLVSDAQIGEWCQIYAFQTENPWHRETQKEIPPAVKPPATHFTGGGGGGLSASAGRYSGGSTTTGGHNSLPRPQTNISTLSTSSMMPQSRLQTMGAGAGSTSLMTRSLDFNPPQEEKVRVVFTEFDSNNDRVIEIEELKIGFRNLGIDFTAATLRDLFQKGDTNHDGRITYPEFERFAKLYPIMIDCLYFRSKLFMDDIAMQQEIQSEKDAVKAAKDGASLAQQSHNDAVRVVEEMQRALGLFDKDIQSKIHRVRELAALHEQAMRDRERAQKERNDREGDLVSVRERERVVRTGQTEIQRELEKVERKLSNVGQEAKMAEEKVRQLQQMLAEASRNADRLREQARETTSALEQLRGKERDCNVQVETVLRELPRLEDAVRQSEGNLNHSADRVRELESLHRDAQREADDSQHKKDTTERQLIVAREQEQRCLEAHREALRVAEERERRMQAREQELLEQQRQRHLVSQHEKQLMEQELRLREQRESLEEKESKLKQDASSFLSQLRTTLAAGRTSTSPYGNNW